jgi:hypothetical protein
VESRQRRCWNSKKTWYGRRRSRKSEALSLEWAAAGRCCSDDANDSKAGFPFTAATPVSQLPFAMAVRFRGQILNFKGGSQ